MGKWAPVRSFSARPPAIEKVAFRSARSHKEMFIGVYAKTLPICSGGVERNSTEEFRPAIVDSFPRGRERLSAPVLFVGPGEK